MSGNYMFRQLNKNMVMITNQQIVNDLLFSKRLS